MTKIKNGSEIYRYVLDQTSKLKSFQGSRKEKYRSNLVLYEDTAGIDLDSFRSTVTVGFRRSNTQRNTTPDMSYNVIKSCIDTLQSMVEERGVRPFLNLKKGQYRDVRIAKILQYFFDQHFEKIGLSKTMANIFKNSAIFDTGVLQIVGKEVKSVLPWQIYVDPAEELYGKITKVYYERKQYPVSIVEDNIKQVNDTTTFGEYWDLKKKIHVRFYETGEMFSETYNGPIPFLKLYFSSPVLKGCNSLADQLRSIQLEINFLLNAVKDASQKTNINSIFMPKGAFVGAKKLNNGVGNIIEYDATRLNSAPLTVSTPPFADPEYMKTFEELKANAAELTGVSQLAQASLKPAGINSGKGLQTLEDIQAGRFESIFRSIVKMYVDLTILFVELQPDEEMVLPEDDFRMNCTWKAAKELMSKMKIQYCGTDAVSKDPATKAQVIQMYIQSGLVPQEMIAQLLEVPDLDTTYSVMQNSWNSIQTVIDRCIFEDKFEIPPFANFLLLSKEIVNTQMMLFTADPEKNLEDINKLTKLFSLVYKANEKYASMLESGQAPASNPFSQVDPVVFAQIQQISQMSSSIPAQQALQQQGTGAVGQDQVAVEKGI